MSGPFSNSPDEGIDDMTSLSVLSEEAILKNIEVRYHREQIYSYVGDILVAVNPYGAIKGLYGLDAVGQYDGVPIGELPPHIFAIGNATYYSLSRTMKNQCIVISGESGAGKTESTKLIIQNFTSLSSSRSLIQDQILEATPILEIFGNAKTVRNDNSSRFGKFIEIQFGTDGSIQGAKILDYLLERSRIINQAPNERNYHVFYGLFSGLTEQEKAKYQLDQPQSFRYLNQSGCHTVEKIHDKEDFNKMRAALKLLNFGEAQESILTVLATILHIGNLKFQKDGQDSIRISNPEILDIIVEFLGLDREQTRQSLITRQIQILGEKATITPLTIPQAVDGQDALAKALYGRMFSWILKKINETICQDKPLPFVGVLDIFGFEDFETNSFEQFCINFANESLQLHFNQFIFKQEQEEYKKEGISWENISFLDNQPCIDLISQKPLGLLPLLDEESNFPKGTDLSLLEKINKTHATNPYFEKIKVAQSAFCIKHYAGKVTYNINGFLDKNRDTLRAEWMTALMSSKNKFVSLLFTAEEVKEDDGAFKTLSRGGGGGRRGGTKVPTIGAQFHTSLTGLVTLLTSCNPYFVRCIKPNTNKLPNQFDRDLVLSQLRYVGLLETVRVRKSGFSVRIPYKDFVTRYGFLVPSAKDADMQSRSTQILQRYSTNPADSAIGKTKVFMKNHVENIIEAERGKKLIRAALQIQKTCKMHLAKTKYKKKKTAVVEMQKVARGFLARKSYKQNYARVIVLQSVIRGWRQRKAYKKMVEEEKERKRREEEEARRRAEEARKKAEKAKKKAEEEKRKRKELERLKKEQAEAEARAKAQAEAEAKAKAETEARIKAEAEARSKAKAEAEALNKAKAEEELKAMEKAREEAEAKSKAIQKAKEESEAQAKAMAAEAEKAEQAVEEAKVEEATAAAEAAEAVALSQNPKKSVIFLSRKQIDELVGYIENLPLHTVPFGEVSTFIPTALDYPLLRQGELSTDDPNFALLIETLTQSGSPAAEGIIKALGQSVESNTFEKFAKVYFNDDSNCFYSAESIHQALLNTVCNDTLLTAKAVRLFYLTNFYIEYADGLTDTFVHRILNYMIEQVGPFPALHDELLSQMCKQTLKNPNQNKSFRAWRLLSILIGIIPPSLKLLPCILNYIVDQAPLDLTARLQYRLWRSVTTGARTKKITSIEFEALKKRVPVILQVDFFDETSTNFEVDTATTSRDSMKILLEAKGLSNRAGYSLYGVYQDTEIHFGENEKVLDIISTLEALAGTSISPEDPTKKPTTNKEFQEPTQENDGGAFQSLEQEPHQIPESEQKLVRALFSFNPTKAGEIPLNRNDIIILYEKTNSEWWKGKSKSTGAFGFFPAMYVAENLPEPPPPLEGEAAAHTVVGNVDGKLFKRKSLGAKDVQLDAPSLNYLVEPLDEKNQRVTINIEKNGKELGIVLRASKKRGCVVSKVDSGGLGSLSGIKEDDQIVSVDDRPIEGLKLEKVLKMIRATENKITFRIVRRLPKPEAAPPPPKTSPPPPVRTTSLWNKAGDYYYPWKLVVKKDFVNPVTKLDDPSDVALVTAQIMASEKGKADKPRFKQLKSSNELAEILDIAMDWPLYFSRKFACVANKLKVDTFAFDYLGCYLLLGKEVVKFCDFDAVHIESSSKEKLTLKIDAELLELQIHNGTAVGEELQTHMKQLLQVARYSIAKRDHVVKDFNMLSFKQGDIIQIVDRADSSDWLLGSFGDKTGWVPSECVRLLYGKPSAFRKDKLKEDEKEEHVQATAAPDFAEFQKKVGECLLTYAKSHFRIDDGADTRSFSTGTMKGTLKRFASSGTKLPEHMLQSKDKDPAETEKEMSVKIKFTFEPIKSPLHKFITSSSDTKAAIEAFSLIMSYMGDYPSKKNRETIVQNLVLFALKSPPMYDEIYCQVVKQLTHNTSERMASIKRGWDLLAICLGCFPPTTILIPYITEFVTLHKDNPGYQFQSNAKECYERLERSKTRTEAFRISPPSLAEVLAIETGTPMSVNIVFPGNVVRNVKVDSFATAADVVNRIAGKVQAINADHYGLFILPGHRISGSDAVPVSNKMAILDVLSLAESVVKEFRPSSEDQPTETKPKKFSKSRSKTKLAGFGMTASDSGNSPSLSYNLVCRKKIWTKEEEFLDSDFVTNILFSQVMEDYLNGNLISMTELHPDFAEVAAQLAALQMKCSQNVGADHFVLHKLVPQVVYQLKDEAWWRDKVPGFFRELKEQPEVIFKRQVLKILQNLPLFGSILYSAKSSPDSRLPNGAVICFSIDGVHILDRLTKLPVISCGYNALIEYRFDTSEFMMNTGDLMNKSRLVVHTKEGSQICNTLDTYIEYLVKKRKVEQKKMQAANQSSSRPSLKKYSPW